MRNIAPAIIAAAQILVVFFFFFTSVMVYQHIIVPPVPTMTLVQCMIPAAAICGVCTLIGLVGFPLGYVAQYIVAPRVVASWEARARRKAARTARVWSFVKKNTHGPRLLAPLPVIMKCDNTIPDVDAQEEPCEVCQTLFLSDEPMGCQYR